MSKPDTELAVAPNFFDAEAVIPTVCPCCGEIKLLLVDESDRVHAVASLSVKDMLRIVADAEAKQLPSYNIEGRAALR